MKRIRELIALAALAVLITGCETSMTSWFDDDEPPAGNATVGGGGNLANVGNAPNTGFVADSGRYPPQQRYYELTLNGFPAGTRCKVRHAQGQVSNRGSGRRIVVSITGFPSLGEVGCSMPEVPHFVIDTNRWVFTQPRRPGISPGDVEKVFVAVEYSLTNAELRPIAEMTMHTAAGKFNDRFALDNLKRTPPGYYGTQPRLNSVAN